MSEQSNGKVDESVNERAEQITIYGEVLFDCFVQPDQQERQVLGGAPFNICWHLQALGDQPNFISRVGDDELGQRILHQAENWGISTRNIQRDKSHPTGRVQVEIIDDEPHYDIRADSAYDFIQAEQVNLSQASQQGILYHGSLALRSDYARAQFDTLLDKGDWSIFLDVNLRSPWWDKSSLQAWIKRARWVKLNIDELRDLGFVEADLLAAMTQFRDYFDNEQVIVTLGADGVAVLTDEGFFKEKPDKIECFVDTVGAGDAFTAIYMHGLMKQWPTQQTLAMAQRFAGKVIGIRGATPDSVDFYQSFFA